MEILDPRELGLTKISAGSDNTSPVKPEGEVWFSMSEEEIRVLQEITFAAFGQASVDANKAAKKYETAQWKQARGQKLNPTNQHALEDSGLVDNLLDRAYILRKIAHPLWRLVERPELLEEHIEEV